jgi:hypothetical protein
MVAKRPVQVSAEAPEPTTTLGAGPVLRHGVVRSGSGAGFFKCPYPGIGRRWIEPDHVPEVWYQTFNTLPWAAEMVGSSREACRLYIGHVLRHWPAHPHTFDAELERYVDNFIKPGNLQVGFNYYWGIRATRRAQIKGEAPSLPRIDLPARVFWGSATRC